MNSDGDKGIQPNCGFFLFLFFSPSSFSPFRSVMLVILIGPFGLKRIGDFVSTVSPVNQTWMLCGFFVFFCCFFVVRWVCWLNLLMCNMQHSSIFPIQKSVFIVYHLSLNSLLYYLYILRHLRRVQCWFLEGNKIWLGGWFWLPG